MAGAVAGAVLLVGAAAGALVLRDDGDSEPIRDRKRATTTTTTTEEQATAAPSGSAAANPAACLEGDYKLARQEYSGPIDTAYGPATLEGGEAGRTITLKADGTFTFKDTGEEDTKFSLVGANPPISGTAKLVADAAGVYTATATTVTVDITSLSGTLTATTSDGQVLPIPLPPDATGVEQTFGFTPNASYTCEGDRVTVRFQVLTLVLERR